MLVATSKPEVYAVPILEHFGLAKYFHHICGALLHPPRGYGKADVIREALACSGVTDLGTAIMVGDRKHDIIGAHKEGIPAIGVLYGYGDRAEHEACGADFLTVTPGVRFADGDIGDQKRVMTPAAAKEIGSDYIVVGRPITAAADPVAAYERCVAEFCD